MIGWKYPFDAYGAFGERVVRRIPRAVGFRNTYTYCGLPGTDTECRLNTTDPRFELHRT
jgi:hypothetical protein